jgi:multiple sugar transport system permease protein
VSPSSDTAAIPVSQIPFRRRLRESLVAYGYLAPASLILAMFWLWPAIFAFYISLNERDIAGNMEWMGVANYTWVLSSDKFLRALMNTVNFVMYTVPTSIALSLFVAVLLNQRIRALNFFRTIYFLPYITSAVAVSVVWLYVFNQNSGLANSIIGWFGFDGLNWLNEPRGIWEMLIGAVIGNEHFRIGADVYADESPLLFMLVSIVRGPSLALTAIIIMTVWRSIGYAMVIFLAGLQGIDKTYYEAADIDGANAWQKFWNITWPLVSPYTFFLAIITTIFAFKEFIGVFIMTPTGGIEYDTGTVVFYLYDLAFLGRFDFGRAAAVGFILFLILTVISLIQKMTLGRRVHYD